MLDKILASVLDVAFVPALLLFFYFFKLLLVFHFLCFVEPAFFRCSYFLGKSQPGVSFKGCSYKQGRHFILFVGGWLHICPVEKSLPL